ncbi:DUF6452 family protein [Psychroserpens luteus]|uniref:DUF6452 family protein n=1 Tax=Psychroserpens luteus TaxID=1434066 RepID=A0ABW5ZN72_9FLAO|nr:DUF6452 family protein [Psychroserpens luteus]
MKNIKFIILFIAIIFYSCERDDICAESTATTPRLIIRFYDINNQDDTKLVRQLEVIGLDENDDPFSETPIVSRANSDSINLPLNFQEEVETITRFQLVRDADFADDTNTTTNHNIDIITVKYTPQFVYVSRACGYKSIFNLDDPLGITRDGETAGDDDTWITSFDITNYTIENENAAQIIIYH